MKDERKSNLKVKLNQNKFYNTFICHILNTSVSFDYP